MNQRYIIQRLFEISDVSDNVYTDLVLYPTILISVFKGMFLPNNFSFEAMSAVGYSTDSKLALYQTALIRNQCCFQQC
jgi:hypothetical protein